MDKHAKTTRPPETLDPPEGGWDPQPKPGPDHVPGVASRVFTGAELHDIAIAAMRGETRVDSPHGGEVLDLTSPDLLAALGRPKVKDPRARPRPRNGDAPDGDGGGDGDVFEGDDDVLTPDGGVDVGIYLDRVTVGHERLVQNAISGLKDRALKEILAGVDYSTTGGMTVDEYRAIECCRRMCISILRLDPYCGLRRGGPRKPIWPEDGGPRPGRDTKDRSPYDDPSLYPRFTNTSGPGVSPGNRGTSGGPGVSPGNPSSIRPGVSPGVPAEGPPGVPSGVDERGAGARVVPGIEDPPAPAPTPGTFPGSAPAPGMHSGDESHAAGANPGAIPDAGHQLKPRSVFTVDGPGSRSGGTFLRTQDLLGEAWKRSLRVGLPRPP